MPEYRVVCVHLLRGAEHRHVVGIGTATDRSPTRWTVDEVWSAMAGGDSFHADDNGRRSPLERWQCSTCGMRTVRAGSGIGADDDLDRLRQC